LSKLFKNLLTINESLWGMPRDMFNFDFHKPKLNPMKKALLIMLIAVIPMIASAQNTSKNGHQITPEAGDWGLGIDVNPWFRFVGNMFNGNDDNSAPFWNFEDNSPIPMTLSGYMLKDENTAYRGKLRLGFGSMKMTNLVNDDTDITGNPPRQVEDERKMSANNILIGAGIQKMRGKHRVRGFYGAEALIGLTGGKTEYSYGNAMSDLNQTPTSTVESSWDSGPYSSPASSRMTESKDGSGFYFGVRGFAGAEYFIGPRISVAGEFGWGIGLMSVGEGESTTQFVDTSGPLPAVRSVTMKTGKSSSFGLDTDSGIGSSSGSLRMTFYF
jgi:hypothetical protein